MPRVELPRGLRRAERDVHAHYDLGNAFFSLWLDESMTYSCALFETPEATLAEAQQAKYRSLADATLIGPGDHVLEIGSGWGGFALHLARERGCRVTPRRSRASSTRSRPGACGRRAWPTASTWSTATTGSCSGCYSRIVSIEMIEAIGHRQLGTYFATIDRLLAPDGLAGIQAILVPDQRYRTTAVSATGSASTSSRAGCCPSLEAITTAARRSSDLMVHDVREIGPHYARTLREWRERFLLRAERGRGARARPYFQRTWEYYLAFCEAAFATHACAMRSSCYAAAQPHARRTRLEIPARVLGVEPGAEQQGGGRQRLGPPPRGSTARPATSGSRTVKGPSCSSRKTVVSSVSLPSSQARWSTSESAAASTATPISSASSRTAALSASSPRLDVAAAGVVPVAGRAVLAVAAQLPEAAVGR